ncbi:NUDIX domain-containing protein [Brevundimonas aveniformis]|uniref:NUDIX domain-containing protein n=1 Tax=Brevundimonas aveniformis TaxID=370977 RepID=UPI00040FCE2D|nr:NUDIX domain-containing protein [Brevundimonas aveniformis]
MDGTILAFGQPEPGVAYRDRPCAFGIAVQQGKIACVRVDRGDRSYFDLPGGAIDGVETESEALAREFMEETGLEVRGTACIGRTAQVFRRSTGEPLRNLSGVWTAEVLGYSLAGKIEDDHELVWLEPLTALSSVRHEAHAWAITLWLRSQQTGLA